MANKLNPFCDWDDEWQEAQRESTFFAEGDILGETFEDRRGSCMTVFKAAMPLKTASLNSA